MGTLSQKSDNIAKSFDQSIERSSNSADLSSPGAAELIRRIRNVRWVTRLFIIFALGLQLYGAAYMIGYDFLEVVAVSADGDFKVLDLINE